MKKELKNEKVAKLLINNLFFGQKVIVKNPILVDFY
jgi:hypothetical protein